MIVQDAVLDIEELYDGALGNPQCVVHLDEVEVACKELEALIAIHLSKLNKETLDDAYAAVLEAEEYVEVYRNVVLLGLLPSIVVA